MKALPASSPIVPVTPNTPNACEYLLKKWKLDMKFVTVVMSLRDSSCFISRNC